jgi:hypothetical protein
MEKKSIINIIIFIIIGVIVGAFIPLNTHQMTMTMDMKRDSFISLRESIQGEQLVHSKYRCCLEKPCIYCIEKTPGHGEGAECSCQEDIYNGLHPCGECIGEILEGHGNPLMSEYFARAIAEKTGQYDAIKEIISEKYNISVEQQL